MGKFVISVRSNGEYQFNLKATNGQTILTSEGYKSKEGCLNGIESVRKNAQDDGQYDRKTASNGKPYFNLKAKNGEIIGTSETYQRAASREKGIASVKANAGGATIEV